MTKATSLQEQAEKILEQAESKGVSTDFFFKTTFDRYLFQIKLLDELKKSIWEHGMTITKEYVRGRENLVANPSIKEYNKTATAANQTVTTLMKIITSLSEEEGGSSKLSELMAALNNG